GRGDFERDLRLLGDESVFQDARGGRERVGRVGRKARVGLRERGAGDEQRSEDAAEEFHGSILSRVLSRDSLRFSARRKPEDFATPASRAVKGSLAPRHPRVLPWKARSATDDPRRCEDGSRGTDRRSGEGTGGLASAGAAAEAASTSASGARRPAA